MTCFLLKINLWKSLRNLPNPEIWNSSVHLSNISDIVYQIKEVFTNMTQSCHYAVFFLYIILDINFIYMFHTLYIDSCLLLLQVSPCLPVLSRLLFSSDSDLLADACWALSYLSDGPNEKIQAVIDSGVCRRLVELLMWVSYIVISRSYWNRFNGTFKFHNDIFQSETEYSAGHNEKCGLD